MINIQFPITSRIHILEAIRKENEYALVANYQTRPAN